MNFSTKALKAILEQSERMSKNGMIVPILIPFYLDIVEC